MSEKPVAWRFMVDGTWFVASTLEACTKNLAGIVPTTEPEPLYSQSPAEARALAIAECITRLSENRVPPKFSESSDWVDGYNDGISDGIDRLRALSPAPSVSEKWVRYVATSGNLFDKKNSGVAFEAVRATLAALGVTVEGAAK